MDSIENIGVIGGGSWGTALSLVLSRNGHSPTLWVYEKELCEILTQTNENQFFLPGVLLPDCIHPTHSIQSAVEDKDVLLLVVPTQVVRAVLEQMAPHIKPGCLIINAGKGIENETLLTIHQIIPKVISSNHTLATLSGPTFAAEIARDVPSAIVAAGEDIETAERVKSLFSTANLKVFTSTDLMGVEMGGALKNVIAIATGISDGLELGHNARAALITRGLVEITRIGTAMGARPETFSGLSGMGDLVLTCTGDLSRNRTVGLQLAQGKPLKEIVENMKMVAEGVRTVISAYNLKNKLRIQASIIEETYQLLHQGKPLKQALSDLMKVEITSEFSGVKGLQ